MTHSLDKLQGYTLIELLIILGIIGVLASLAVPAFVGYTAIAQQSKAMEQINEIAQGVERYYTENRNYPATVTSISPDPCFLCQDDYFNYSLLNIDTSTYTVEALKSSGAAKYDLRLDHRGRQSHAATGTSSWVNGWP